jgi:hypothetical protein
MFTIEHDFDASVITLIDEGGPMPLQGDITITTFEDCVTVEQADPDGDEPVRITFSLAQMADLQAALNLPEGSYRLSRAET